MARAEVLPQVGQVIQCPATFSFLYKDSKGTHYDLAMNGPNWGNAPRTSQVQIQCNALGTNGYCDDWFTDPIPVVNSDGTTSAGQAIARLLYVTTNSATNLEDFYLTFHVHLTRHSWTRRWEDTRFVTLPRSSRVENCPRRSTTTLRTLLRGDVPECNLVSRAPALSAPVVWCNDAGPQY